MAVEPCVSPSTQLSVASVRVVSTSIGPGRISIGDFQRYVARGTIELKHETV